MYNPTYDAIDAMSGTLETFVWIFLISSIITIVARWRLFEKMGQPGWKTLIPFYNTWTMFKCVMGSGWWMFTYLIPFVGVLVGDILLVANLASSFGKGFGYAVLIFLFSPIMYCVLAFGKSQYVGQS